VVRATVAVLTAVGLLTCAGCGAGSPAPSGTASPTSTPSPASPTSASPTPVATASQVRESGFSLLQVNVCLSGFSGCFARTAYPAVVDEVVRIVRDRRPTAVSLNEACAVDAREIARRTGYHVRFSEVIYAGALLPCVDPGGRGLFGNALLTKARVTDARDEKFSAQLGPEERRWLCATTGSEVTVCSAHLGASTGSDRRRTNNERQCVELARILTRYARQRPTIFAGDVNRQGSCAPDGHWSVTDSEASGAAGTDPGIQHVYGSGDFAAPRGTVVPATRSDHDYLLVQTRLRSRRNRRSGGCAA
jgi:endonuclease/exonuclease/phosphatase family metal-dependent hydrolase